MAFIDMHAKSPDHYITGKGAAWFAFAMTFVLMLFDYIDRQVIVSLFPHIKAEWNVSDKELGGLVSIISIVVALGGIPVALLADRMSRVKSIVAMATVWSLATISCMFTGSYGQLFAARAAVGAGETGYGSVGAALLFTLFPQRLRGAVLGALFAAGSLGSVLGVVLGGVIAAKWGWKAAFGVVGAPGLVFALLYLLVKDYKTVVLTPKLDGITHSISGTVAHIFTTLARTPTLLWVCIGASMQMIVLSTIWAWVPSYLNRFHGMTPLAASKQTALVVLVGAVGSVFWGWAVDRVSLSRSRNRLPALAVLCTLGMVVFLAAFTGVGRDSAQIQLILVGAFFMTCTSGVVPSICMNVIHPGVRSTGSAVLSLFQNLFGLAVGPFLGGVISDLWGLEAAMAVIPLFGALAALFFLVAMRSYEQDAERVNEIPVDASQALAA